MRRITELQLPGVIEQLDLKADRSGAVIILEAVARRMPSASGDAPAAEFGVTSFDVNELAPAQ